MLLPLLDVLFKDPLRFFAILPVLLATVGLALLLGLTIHEASHAFVAYRQGDRTARRLGRLTLNPLAHLDPMGTTMLLVVGFGWGKPVPVNPYALRLGPRQGMALVAAAGPISNLLIAGLFALPIKLGLIPWHSPFSFDATLTGGATAIAGDIFGFIIFFNILLAIFNLIPISPLDGFRVALGLLPRSVYPSAARLELYGPGILLTIIAIDFLTNAGILLRIITPPVNLIGSWLVGHSIV